MCFQTLAEKMTDWVFVVFIYALCNAAAIASVAP